MQSFSILTTFEILICFFDIWLFIDPTDDDATDGDIDEGKTEIVLFFIFKVLLKKLDDKVAFPNALDVKADISAGYISKKCAQQRPRLGK